MTHPCSCRDRQALSRTALACLIPLLLVTWASPSGDAAQLNVGAERPANSIPEPCRALRRSSQQTSDLIQNAITYPTVDSYGALGEAFAGQSQFDCAAAAYELALACNPKAWQTRYAL